MIFSSVVLKLMFLINNVVSGSGSSMSSSGSFLTESELVSSIEIIQTLKTVNFQNQILFCLLLFFFNKI